MENKEAEKPDDLPVSAILEKVKDGLLDPKMLCKPTRQACIEVLIMEGYSQPSIAALFKKTDRTIRRDIAEIRQQNAVTASPELTRRLVGELMTNAQSIYANLKKIARSKESSPNEKTRAEFMAWKVWKELIEKLYLVGFLTSGDCQDTVIEPPKSVDVAKTVSHKDARLMRWMGALPRMEQHMILDRLMQEIHQLSEMADEQQENRDDGAQEDKKEENPTS